MWKMSGLKERSGFLRLLQKTTVCRRNFASLPRQARERPGQIWLREAPVTWRSCHSAGQLFLAFGNSVPALALFRALVPAAIQSKAPVRFARQWGRLRAPRCSVVAQQLSQSPIAQELAIHTDKRTRCFLWQYGDGFMRACQTPCKAVAKESLGAVDITCCLRFRYSTQTSPRTGSDSSSNSAKVAPSPQPQHLLSRLHLSATGSTADVPTIPCQSTCRLLVLGARHSNGTCGLIPTLGL
jgi:hypothetical protein